MTFTGAIFDMDGTLLDSMPIWDRVGMEYLAGLGIRARPDLPQRLLTMTMRQAAACFRAEYGVALPDAAIIDGINARIEAFYRESAPEKAGAAAFLQALRRRGVAMCVATATDRPLAEAALRRTGLLPFFDFLLTCTEAGGKDCPEIFRRAQMRLGTPREQTLVFEDALYAIRTAKRAGFPVAAVFDPSSRADQEEIRKTADFYVASFLDAKEVLL